MLSSRPWHKHRLLPQLTSLPPPPPPPPPPRRTHATLQSGRYGLRRAHSAASAYPIAHPGHHHQQIHNATIHHPPSPSRIRRILKGSLWATLFFISGFITIQAVVTIPYLTKSRREPGSELDLRLMQSITQKIDSSVLVQQLKAQGWVEDAPFDALVETNQKNGRHLVHETLPRPGVRGVSTRVFRWPSSKVSLVVVHVGPGCESWPQFAHGGLTTTLLVEAVENHLMYYYPGRAVLTEQDVTVNFKLPVRTHGIYAITVSPIMDQLDDGRSFINLEAQFDRLATPPKIIEHLDSKSGTASTTEVKKFDAQMLAAAQVRMPATHMEQIHHAKGSVQP